MKSPGNQPSDFLPLPADTADVTRRRLLAKASCLGALGICTVLGSATPAADIATHLKMPESKSFGYQESPHVKAYYSSARYW
jgi:hypothetical protein